MSPQMQQQTQMMCQPSFHACLFPSFMVTHVSPCHSDATIALVLLDQHLMCVCFCIYAPLRALIFRWTPIQPPAAVLEPPSSTQKSYSLLFASEWVSHHQYEHVRQWHPKYPPWWHHCRISCHVQWNGCVLFVQAGSKGHCFCTSNISTLSHWKGWSCFVGASSKGRSSGWEGHPCTVQWLEGSRHLEQSEHPAFHIFSHWTSAFSLCRS